MISASIKSNFLLITLTIIPCFSARGLYEDPNVLRFKLRNDMQILEYDNVKIDQEISRLLTYQHPRAQFLAELAQSTTNKFLSYRDFAGKTHPSLLAEEVKLLNLLKDPFNRGTVGRALRDGQVFVDVDNIIKAALINTENTKILRSLLIVSTYLKRPDITSSLLTHERAHTLSHKDVVEAFRYARTTGHQPTIDCFLNSYHIRTEGIYINRRAVTPDDPEITRQDCADKICAAFMAMTSLFGAYWFIMR